MPTVANASHAASFRNQCVFRRGKLPPARNIRGMEPSKIPVPAPSKSIRFQLTNEWRQSVTISIAHLQPIVALAAGILILIMPRLLNYIVALYLIVVGILGLGILK
jgi:hypothetical protein